MTTSIPNRFLASPAAAAVALCCSLASGVTVALIGLPDWLPVALLAGAGAALGLTARSDRLRVVLGGCALIGVFAWVYINALVPVYAYDGTLFLPSDALSIAIALGAAALPLLWLPNRVARPSQIVLWLMFIFAYIPAILVPFFATGDLRVVGPLMLTIVVGMALLSAIVRVPVQGLSARGLPMGSWTAAIVLGALLTSAYIVWSFGFPSSIPGIEAVYDTRRTFKDALVGAVGPAGYIIPWAGTVITPLIFATGLARRRWLLLALAALCTLLIYSVTGFKSVIFGPVLSVGIFALVSARATLFGSLLAVVSAAALLGSTGFTVVTGNPWGLALIPERLFALPGVLTRYYFDFFSANPVYELRHSILSFFGNAPYDLSPPNLIGLIYFNNSSTSANANLWADGIANFGLPGAILMSGLFGLALRLLDKAAVGRDLRIIGPAMGLMALNVSNTGALTSLLTGGLLLMILLIALMPRAPSVVGSAVSDTERLARRPLNDGSALPHGLGVPVR